jgi:hypothetical protein
MIPVLAQLGAKINIKNKGGMTALDITQGKAGYNAGNALLRDPKPSTEQAMLAVMATYPNQMVADKPAEPAKK